MIQPKPLPLSQDELNEYRFLAQKKSRPSLIGGHVGRRKGQSLEFREHMAYQFGDDVRHIDWRASARYRGGSDWLVRRFVAEEEFKLVLSIDTRPSMSLPESMDKRQIAFWLVEALSRIALPAENRVVWHHLFGNTPAQELRGARDLKRVPQMIRQFGSANTPSFQPNIEALERGKHLPPTAVWLIISDLYFDWDDEAKRLAQRITTAQDGLRWIILVDLDSWPFERAWIGRGARKIEGPGLNEQAQKQLQIEEMTLGEVDRRIKNHKDFFLDAITRGGCDISHWPWPPPGTMKPQDFFRQQFGRDDYLQKLFMRDK